MSYDPIARGDYPVGVQRIEIRDAALADRPVPIEVWYPTADAYRGRDLDDATRDHVRLLPGLPDKAQNAVRAARPRDGVFPLVVYFHGGYGHQLECTHLCTHLASHGYVVAAPAFPGDNLADLRPGADGSQAAAANTPIDESATRRPRQASLFIGHLMSCAPAGLAIDADRIGVAGISMGGFTALAVNSVSRLPKAVFAMCPMWGQRSMVPQVRRLGTLLRTDNWERPVSACILTGELDPMVHADDMRLLYRQLAPPRRLFVLAKAGHLHWPDGAAETHELYRLNYLSGAFPDPEIDGIALGTAMRPFSELCTEEDAGDAARGLCVAHMDAELRHDPAAREFLDAGAARVFAARGVGLDASADTARPAALV